MKPAKNNSAETEAIKLLHELDVFKEELHMQNEELVQAVVNAETATALYDFAPSGYFTLDCDSNICELNLSGAMMLGKERSRLIHSNFKFFLSTETLPVFISFTDKLFESKNKQTCEVQLSFHGKPAIYLHIEGIVSF